MKTIMFYILIPLGSILFLVPALSAFSVSTVEFDPQGTPAVTVPVVSSNYYVLLRIDLENDIEMAVAAALPSGGLTNLVLADPVATGTSTGFYRVKQIPFATPEDADGDGMDDFFELQHPLLLNPLDASDASEDADEDGASNRAEYLAASNPADVISTNITFTTSDGILISGTHRRPAARPGTKLSAVILIHQGNSSRSEWNPYLSAFTTAGYATLAYDIRGHGLSGGTFITSDYNNPNTVPKDLIAALAYVRAQPSTESTRVGIVGASVGGNLACVASQKRWVKTAVNLSGKTTAVRNLAAESELDLESIFHISSSGDQNGKRAIWANELHGFTASPRHIEIVSGSSAHGVSILAADPTLLDRIIAWLNTTL